MAAALRFGKILEGGAAVAEHAVVDELHLPGFEVEIGRQRLVVEHIEHRGDRRSAVLIDRLAANGAAAADLMRTEAGAQFPDCRERRRRKNRIFAGMKLALPV